MVDVSTETLAAFGTLNDLLTVLSERLGQAGPALPAAVVDFRAWLLAEVASQAAGNEPRRCELPT